jgi:hypothetical protein
MKQHTNGGYSTLSPPRTVLVNEVVFPEGRARFYWHSQITVCGCFSFVPKPSRIEVAYHVRPDLTNGHEPFGQSSS